MWWDPHVIYEECIKSNAYYEFSVQKLVKQSPMIWSEDKEVEATKVFFWSEARKVYAQKPEGPKHGPY
jgi:hypothetical protein